MKDSVTVKHRENMSFTVSINGHEMILDAGHRRGGDNLGPRPKSLLLASLAGCTGMDVISILKKMRIEFKDFSVKVDGNITEEHPMHFDHMHIIYTIHGKDIPVTKVQMAIDLSLEKYCGVSYNLAKSMKITHELIVESDNP